MNRYGIIHKKRKREIVLLKGHPCFWGKCTFCDYIEDNSSDDTEINAVNDGVLSRVTGIYGALEVINSGSVFELPPQTLERIKTVKEDKKIGVLYFESCYQYRDRLKDIRDYFGGSVVFKCGVETFDAAFRNGVLNKGLCFDSPQDVARHFEAVCLLVGVRGQTREMIDRDIDIMLKYFKYGCVNIFSSNTTKVTPDAELAEWFAEKYAFLEANPDVDVLWNNTDFGVGGME